MDQNRDGFIDKNDLRDTFAALGETHTLHHDVIALMSKVHSKVIYNRLSSLVACWFIRKQKQHYLQVHLSLSLSR